MLRFASAILVTAMLASTAEASAQVARLRVHFDTTPAPQIYVAAYNPQLSTDPGGGARSCTPPAPFVRGGPCTTPWNPYTGISDTHWEGTETADVAFVDDAPTRARYFAFALAFDGSSAGRPPNPYAASGTATVTDLDGATRTISFTRQPGQDILMVGQTPDPTVPPPPPPPEPPVPPRVTVENCTLAALKAEPPFLTIWKATVEGIRRRGIRDLRSNPRIDNVLTCPRGRIVARIITRRRGRSILLARVDKAFRYGSIGRSTHRLTLTKKGRRMLADRRRLWIRVTVRLYDDKGGSIRQSRSMTVGKPLDRN